MKNDNRESKDLKVIEDTKFKKALENVKVPFLVLDEKWHHLFAGVGKTKEIVYYEQQVNELLKLQGRLNTDLKALKKVKNDLLDGIMNNMDDQSTQDQNKRLVEETNEKIEEVEDRLLDLPRELDEANKLLMIYSMDACYNTLYKNAGDIEEIGTWIKKMRIELKKNIIIKQAAELKNKEIYGYMHDILGAKAIDVFDLKFDQDGQVVDRNKDVLDEKNSESKEESKES